MEGYVIDWSAVGALVAATAASIAAAISFWTTHATLKHNETMERLKWKTSWVDQVLDASTVVLNYVTSPELHDGTQSSVDEKLIYEGELAISRLVLLLPNIEKSSHVVSIVRTLIQHTRNGTDWATGETPADFVRLVREICELEE